MNENEKNIESKDNVLDKIDVNINKRDNNDNKEDLFNLFMKEIEDIDNLSNNKHLKSQKTKRAKISKLLIEGKINQVLNNSDEHEFKIGKPNEEILRLTSRIFSNAYEILDIPIDSDQATINKKYRKLSLLIHPDKSNHEKAREAFEVLKKGYEELQKAENRTKYKQVWKRAEELVRKEMKKKRMNKGDEFEFQKEFNSKVMEMSEKLLKDLEERKEYSERCLLANQRFEQELYRKKLEEEKNKCLERKKWNESFEERTQGWRQYKRNNSEIFNSSDD